MKNKMLAMMLLAGSSMFAPAAFAGTRFSIGLGFGAPPAYAVNVPPCPGPGYTWVAGYWTNDYARRVWVPGFWSAPVVAFHAAPRFDNHFVVRDDHRFDNHFVAHDDRRFDNRRAR